MNLLLLEPEELDEEGRFRLEGRRARHLRSVLKVAPGASLRAGLIEGPIGRAEVEAVRPELRLRFVPERPAPPRPPVDLLLAVPRPKALKRLYAPLASLGIGRLLLLNAKKVEPSYYDSHALDPALVRERFLWGLEQAVDTRLPQRVVLRSFKAALPALGELSPGAHRLLADPLFEGSPRAASAALRERDPQARVLLAIGPEGGFTDYERDALLSAGFEGVGLGTRVLRAETAALCLLALVHDGLRATSTKS